MLYIYVDCFHTINIIMKSNITAALLFLLVSKAANAAMTFSVVFSAQADIDLSAADQALFTDGLNFWDDIIVDHLDGSSMNWVLNVDTFDTPASGGGITLGSAGPGRLVFSGIVPGSGLGIGTIGLNRYLVSTGGNASFNVNPAAGALQAAVIRHEIGHALGIGTLWEDNEVYNDGVASNSNRTLAGGLAGQYVGASALAAFQAEFDSEATFIPVERDGGGGTANGHWNEVTDNFNKENALGFDADPGDGGPAPVSVDGSLDDELMTGVLSGSAYLSQTTIASLQDIGFEVVAVPEPSSTMLLALSSFGFIIRRRR